MTGSSKRAFDKAIGNVGTRIGSDFKKSQSAAESGHVKVRQADSAKGRHADENCSVETAEFIGKQIRSGFCGYGTPEANGKAMIGAGSGNDPPDPLYSSSDSIWHRKKQAQHFKKTMPKHHKSVTHRQNKKEKKSQKIFDQNRHVSALTVLNAIEDEHNLKSKLAVKFNDYLSP